MGVWLAWMGSGHSIWLVRLWQVTQLMQTVRPSEGAQVGGRMEQASVPLPADAIAQRGGKLCSFNDFYSYLYLRLGGI